VSTVTEPLSRPLLFQRINQLLDETARISESDVEPAAYHREFLQRLLTGTTAVAGAIWVPSADGGVRAAHHVNLPRTGLDASEADRRRHEELLREALRTARTAAYAPHSGGEAAGNPTDYPILLAPITIEAKAVGVVEIWLPPEHGPDVQTALGQFLAGMAHYASIYYRNRQVRTLAVQQQLWQRLETFSRQVQASLDLSAVAYTIANEGCRLVECDRLSIVGRRGRKATVEAVSGVDVIEKRSVQARLLAGLCASVLAWGERLVYRGSADESLPPDVFDALNAYLASSPAKLLCVLPLGDERKGPARFALLLECFEPPADVEPLLARLDVIGRHARGALENAAVYRRVPVRGLWQRLGRLREETGSRVGLGVVIAALAVVWLLAGVALFPWPLKVEATGQLLPSQRRCLYAPVEGRVVHFEQAVQPGGLVAEGQSVVLMYDTQLELRVMQLSAEIAAVQDDLAALAAQQNLAHGDAERATLNADRRQKEFVRDCRLAELKALRERTHSDEAHPGYFWLKAPLGGTVLDWDFREKLTNKLVRPSESLLRIGDKDKGWEVELRIAPKALGPILEAFAAPGAPEELDVDLLVASVPTRTFRGKLARRHLAAAASHDDGGQEPFVRASVRLDGPDIPDAERLPRELLVTGTEVHARVRCGDHPLVRSLFHGAWEWFYETVLFY
jgi:outer membrane murein-binding lipoprotein Lpp